MRLTHNPHTHDGLGQPPAGLPATWGIAAGAKFQISPGASALAAPHQQLCTLMHGRVVG